MLVRASLPLDMPLAEAAEEDSPAVVEGVCGRNCDFRRFRPPGTLSPPFSFTRSMRGSLNSARHSNWDADIDFAVDPMPGDFESTAESR